jgi:hypothetical protein
MRAAFLLLLAVNLALFAWYQYYSPAESVVDTEPARRQINRRKSACWKARNWPVLVAARPKPAPAAGPAAAPGAPGGSCVEWGGFAVAEAPKAEQALAPLALGARLSQRRSEEKAGWWVFIPPQANRAAALKKTAELKTLGIDEFFVLQDEGKMRWAVSLGVFSSEEAARSRLEALRAKGVRSAQTGERGRAGVQGVVSGTRVGCRAARKAEGAGAGTARNGNSRMPVGPTDGEAT